MGLLDKLFGNSSNKKVPSKPKEKETIKLKEKTAMKKSIFDFFKIDLKQLPDDTFVEAEREINASGDEVINYRKSLDYKECGIFDTIEIKIIGGSGKNIFFKSYDPDSINITKMKELIDDLYLIHGNDGSDKGKFNSNDMKDYKDMDFCMLFGRSWSDYPKYKNPVTVGRDENEVSISIWGIE